MAIMIPEETCRPNEPTHPENVVFDAVERRFDDSWTVFHSLRNIGTNRDGKFIDAEVDFIFVHPHYGVLCVEVKGGDIRHERGRWTQNGGELEQSPATQARHNRYNIEAIIDENIKTYDSVSYGFAVCFPNVFSNFTLTPDLRFITLTGNDLANLEASIVSIMKHWNKHGTKMPKAIEKAVISIISPKFEIGTSLVDRIGQEEREIFRLTEQQCQLLDFIDNHKRATIRGCGGSGKTVLAVKKAKRLAKQGHSVLFLTYNILISERIQKQCQEYPNIKVINFHGFCIETMKVPRPKTDEEWTFGLPSQFFEYIIDHPIKYDAVIVDEAQDFRVEYWDSVPELVAKDGWFYIFYDPDQNLYGTRLKLPDLGNEFILNKNCRNTLAICNEIKDMASIAIDAENVPEGSPIERYSAKTPFETRNILAKLLHNLIVNEGISNESIVVLGAHNLNNTSLGDDNHIKTFTILENRELPDEKSVAYHTFYKFKGCESDVVVILDYTLRDRHWAQQGALYTAMTRAKHKLYIIGKDF